MNGKLIAIYASMAAALAAGCSVAPVKPGNGEWQAVRPPATVQLKDYKNPNTRGSYQNKDLSLALALSGGGARSANLAVGVMMGLELISKEGSSVVENNLLMEVDYISTVSGGGLAAGVYLESLDRYLRDDGRPEAFLLAKAFGEKRINCEDRTKLKRQLERGYHDDILDGLWQPKVWLTNADRGDAVERELDRAVLGAVCSDRRANPLRLGDFFIRSSDDINPKLPMWVVNATIFQNGWIFPFAPNVIDEYRIDGYWHNLAFVQSESGIVNSYDLPMSVGLKASASFPVAIPASTLRTKWCEPLKCYLHLADGGLSDNLGFVTALEILLNEDEGRRKLMIVVDAFPGDLVPFSKKAGSPNAVQVLSRTTEINKDSFRHLIRHNGDFFDNVNKSGIRILYLTIDDFDFIRSIKTNLNVSQDEQRDLVECGIALVKNNEKTIKKWLEGDPDQDNLRFVTTKSCKLFQ